MSIVIQYTFHRLGPSKVLEKDICELWSEFALLCLVHSFSINLLTCIYWTLTVCQVILDTGIHGRLQNSFCYVHGPVGWTDKLASSQSVGEHRRKALSLGGPVGPVSRQKDFSEEVIFKSGFGGKTTVSFFKNLF